MKNKFFRTLAVTLAAVLCHFLGANGVWHAFWITEVLSAIVAYPVYRKAVGKC